MLQKIKENIGLIATGIALMGTIGTGISTAADIVNTLQGIDERMEFVEREFGKLKEETMVTSDIAVLYEKIQDLERSANEADYLREKLVTLEANYWTLQESVRESGFDTQNKYIPEKWEWQDMNDAITRVETMNQTIQQKQWEVDDLKTRIAFLEANLHNH
jgi:polyhydroxyalkanoate synthesis regulator phasin